MAGAVVTMIEVNGEMSRTVGETTGPTTIVVQAIQDREDMFIEAVRVLPAILGTNGKMSRTAVQPLMVPGVITATIMTATGKEPSTIEAVQEAPVIITLQPKLSLSRTAVKITVVLGVTLTVKTMMFIIKKPVMIRVVLVEAAITILSQWSL